MTRLRRSDPSAAGFHRIPSGRGFSYRGSSGETVRDDELRARFDALAIPPAWTEVWIAPFPNGHIQATGLDAAGRRQYIYHPSWRERRDPGKFGRALALAESLPAARRQVARALRKTGDPRGARSLRHFGCWTPDHFASEASGTRRPTAVADSPPCCALTRGCTGTP